MSDTRLYSQKEIQELLKKATDLQKKEGGKKNEEGLTLEEIEQIAADSGIDPMYIREALSASGTSPSSEKNFHILGAPLSLEIGREIPTPMSMEEWEQVVQEARRTFHKSGGTVQKLGNSFEWMTPESKFVQSSITATPGSEKTRFFVSSHFGKTAFMMYYLTSVFTFLTMGGIVAEGNFSTLPGLTLFLAAIATVFVGTRFIFSKLVAAQKKKIDAMISRFELILNSDKKEKDAQTTKTPSGSISIPDEDVIAESEQESNARNILKS